MDSINLFHFVLKLFFFFCNFLGKGGKNRRRGKNENETEKRELVFKEDGQGNYFIDFLNTNCVFESLRLILHVCSTNVLASI